MSDRTFGWLIVLVCVAAIVCIVTRGATEAYYLGKRADLAIEFAKWSHAKTGTVYLPKALDTWPEERQAKVLWEARRLRQVVKKDVRE